MISKITSAAREQLSNIWIIAVLTMLVANIILGVVSLSTVGIIVLGHFSVGLAMWSLDVAKGNEPRLERIFDGFKSFESTCILHPNVSIGGCWNRVFNYPRNYHSPWPQSNLLYHR